MLVCGPMSRTVHTRLGRVRDDMSVLLIVSLSSLSLVNETCHSNRALVSKRSQRKRGEVRGHTPVRPALTCAVDAGRPYPGVIASRPQDLIQHLLLLLPEVHLPLVAPDDIITNHRPSKDRLLIAVPLMSYKRIEEGTWHHQHVASPKEVQEETWCHEHVASSKEIKEETWCHKHVASPKELQKGTWYHEHVASPKEVEKRTWHYKQVVNPKEIKEVLWHQEHPHRGGNMALQTYSQPQGGTGGKNGIKHMKPAPRRYRREEWHQTHKARPKEAQEGT
uniref:Uncharacterized protein n=1 Tax=Timema poppense TaxID=170557 RepID=A0A7R9CNH1_TIMPO|nr:unnamed protein product [Timema poppensis]